MKKHLKKVITIFVLGFVVYFLYINGFQPPWVQLQRPSDKDFFFLDVALDFSAPNICDKINPHARAISFDEISYYRSECYNQVALKTHNPDLCDKVKSLSTIFLWGSKMSRANCIKKVQRGDPAPNITHVGYYDLSKMLPLMGFTEERIKEFRHFSGPIPPSSREDFFVSFYVDLEGGHVPAREEFLAGVRKL